MLRWKENYVENTQKKYITISANGDLDNGKTLYLEPDWSFQEFLNASSQRLNLVPVATRAFNVDGVEIDDCMMIEDNDQVFLSHGDDFSVPLIPSTDGAKEGGESIPSLVGGYKVSKFLGRGGFGEVRVGEHQVTGEKVALKFLRKADILSIGAAERTATEIQCLSTLKHQNIIRLQQHIETANHLVLVFEVMEGGDLLKYLCKREKTSGVALSEDEARSVFHQILSGVSFAHNQHICHRDLKLENILLKGPTLQHVKIADFGLSDFYRPGATMKSNCGTISFLAPEVFRGTSNAGPPLDVWSLGVILFALLCGRLPFEGSELCSGKRPRDAVIRTRILKCQYKIDDHLGPEIKDLIRRMLKLDPDERASIPEIFNHCWMRPIHSSLTMDSSGGLNGGAFRSSSPTSNYLQTASTKISWMGNAYQDLSLLAEPGHGIPGRSPSPELARGDSYEVISSNRGVRGNFRPSRQSSFDRINSVSDISSKVNNAIANLESDIISTKISENGQLDRDITNLQDNTDSSVGLMTSASLSSMQCNKAISSLNSHNSSDSLSALKLSMSSVENKDSSEGDIDAAAVASSFNSPSFKLIPLRRVNTTSSYTGGASSPSNDEILTTPKTRQGRASSFRMEKAQDFDLDALLGNAGPNSVQRLTNVDNSRPRTVSSGARQTSKSTKPNYGRVLNSLAPTDEENSIASEISSSLIGSAAKRSNKKAGPSPTIDSQINTFDSKPIDNVDSKSWKGAPPSSSGWVSPTPISAKSSRLTNEKPIDSPIAFPLGANGKSFSTKTPGSLR